MIGRLEGFIKPSDIIPINIKGVEQKKKEINSEP